MASTVEHASIPRHDHATKWAPLVVLPIAAACVGVFLPRWMVMWTLAVALYAAAKWATFVDCPASQRRSWPRSLGYLFFWPGMDARTFLAPTKAISAPRWAEWLSAAAKTLVGVAMLRMALANIDRYPLAAGWLGFAGIVCALHFGMFHLLALGWRRAGVDAVPIMHAPILADSLADFWGRRWNLAFRDLSHTLVFRPNVARLGAAGATMFVFFVSGIVHDAVISVPAGAGYGLPTLYFLMQGVGLLIERTRSGRKFGLGRGFAGRVFCAIATLMPVPLLFHRPFIERAVLPMLSVLQQAIA